MAGETNVVPYSGTARPWDSVIEPVLGGPLKAGHAIRQWLDAQGCTCRGYLLPDGRLIGSRFILSASEQAAADAAAAAKTASDAQIETFRQSIRDLAVLVRNNTATAAQQRTLMVKLARVADNLLSDLP